MTPTGRATGAQLYARAIQSGRLLQLYLPYDFSWLVRNFYRVIRPKFGLVMETEAWPRLLLEAWMQQLPLILVNARLSEKSFRNFSKYGFLAEFLMACFHKILAQTPLDANRFEKLGCEHVSVIGNLKFDVKPNEDLVREAAKFKQVLGSNLKIFCAASTREGEETIILDAWQRFLESYPQLKPSARLIIVPRHPERFDQVAELIRARLPMVRKSQVTPNEMADALRDGAVVLGDTMGQMTFYYAICDVVMMGGSFAPLGGQNFIEACAMGRPILLGQHTFNFQQAAIDAIEMGAALRVLDEDQLIHAMDQLMRDLTLFERMSASALDYSLAHAGAIDRVLQQLPH
jgi:3-deoxy-D-manno-octulosonic-acid transferase